MNYFAHARDHLDDPYFVAGVALPDWLNMVDRRVRVRSKQARPLAIGDDPPARIARGVVRHHHDDSWFHGTRAFAELSMRFSSSIRECLPAGDGWRTGFLGHILVELLLDAELIARQPQRLEAYYAALRRVDPAVVAETTERISGRAAPGLAALIPRFIEERFLSDYADDAKLAWRINQVLRRVGLEPLPAEFRRVLPAARGAVGRRCEELLRGEAPPTCGEPPFSYLHSRFAGDRRIAAGD